RALVGRVALAAGAHVAGAQVTGRVEGGAVVGGRPLDLTLPRALRAVRRHHHPPVAQRVVAAVGVLVGAERRGGHGRGLPSPRAASSAGPARRALTRPPCARPAPAGGSAGAARGPGGSCRTRGRRG